MQCSLRRAWDIFLRLSPVSAYLFRIHFFPPFSSENLRDVHSRSARILISDISKFLQRNATLMMVDFI